nr:MAG: ORF1 [TTV-like mini virus]
MPWWNYRPRRRPWRRYWRRPRRNIFKRYWRRRRVRRRRFHRKLKKIKLSQFQPKKIRLCKIKGPICLIQTTSERISNDFDLYDLSEVPEHLPGGGGWGIKVYSLLSLYSEHEYARNTWSTTNTNLPLCRYLGCKLIFYQSEFIDYVITFTNELPMHSSLGMYNAMQPSIHSMLPHKLIVPSRTTYPKKKPYFKFRVGPPTQLENKWYFQQDMAKIPLLMTRVTAMSLQHFYINQHNINTNMNITSLHPVTFQNRNFRNIGTGYWATQREGKKYYLYAYRPIDTSSGLKPTELIPLADTKNFVEGQSYTDVNPGQWAQNKWQQYCQNITKYYGNPFHPQYLQKDTPVFLIPQSPSEIFKQTTSSQEPTPIKTFSPAPLTKTLRYNPYSDQGTKNMAFFKSNNKEETNWLPPDNPELYNENLPFWILLWGFPDWHRKIKKHLHLDTDYILTMTQEPSTLHREFIIPLSESFLNGNSPYEKDPQAPPNPADMESWYPQLQYQVEIINLICSSGPGTVKLPPNFSAEALMRYTFYFKWGGSPAPMSQIEDPTEQIKYIIPGTQYETNSLQNPESNPEKILWSFDQRRHYITQRAMQRLQKDERTEKAFVTGGSLFQDYSPQQEQTTSEEDSEKEEETSLFQQLQLQRDKQRRIKHRIMKTLKKIQQLE